MTDPNPPKDLVSYGVQVQGAPFDPIGAHTRNAALGAAVDISATRPANADKVQIQSETQNVRFTLDGTVPTAAIGFLLLPTMGVILIGCSDATQLQVIEAVGGAVINYQWGT